MAERGTRFQRSVVTFGPVGRVVATVLAVAPLWWLVFGAGVLGIVGAAMWLFFVLPRALADIWRPALLPTTDLTRLRDAAHREAELQRGAGLGPDGVVPRPDPPRRW